MYITLLIAIMDLQIYGFTTAGVRVNRESCCALKQIEAASLSRSTVVNGNAATTVFLTEVEHVRMYVAGTILKVCRLKLGDFLARARKA